MNSIEIESSNQFGVVNYPMNNNNNTISNSPSTPRKASIMMNNSPTTTSTPLNNSSTTTSPNNQSPFSPIIITTNSYSTPVNNTSQRQSTGANSQSTPMNLEQISKVVDEMGELSGGGFQSRRSSSTHSHHGSTNSTTVYNDIDIAKVAQFFDNFDSLDEDTWKELLLNCYVPSSQHLSSKKKKTIRKHSKHNETNQESQSENTTAENAKQTTLDTTSVLSSKGALMDLSGLYHISMYSLYRLKQLLYFRFFFFTTQAMKLGNELTTLTINNSLSVNRNSIKLNRNSTRFTDLSNNNSLGSPSGSVGSPVVREVEVMSRKEFTSMKEDILDTWKQFKFATEPSLKPLWTKYLLNIKFNSIQKCTLMHLASKYNQSVIMEWLFDECGPDFLFVLDAMKMTPLFYTSFFNATESCAFLCTKIKSATFKSTTRARSGSEYISSPHSHSGGSGRKSFFGKNKADVPSPTSSSPSGGSINNNALEKIIQQVDDEFGYNVVYVALKRGCFAVCDMLILFGASLDTTIRGGETMLHRACFELPLDRIIYLIQKGAILLKKDQKGCVPLFNLIGREVEQQQVPTQPSPRALSTQSSMRDVHTIAESEPKRESIQVPDEDIQLIEEFLLEHELSKGNEKDDETINESTKYDSPRVDISTDGMDAPASFSNQAISPTTSVGSCDTDASADIFQELDEMFVDESGEVNYQNKNKLLTNDRRKKREPLKLPAALKMRSDSLAALSGINGMAGSYTSNQQGVILEDSIKVKASSQTSSSPINVKTNTNGSRFPNHISHCLQDEFSLKKNIMFKAMELLVPQMGWSTKTLILSAKKFYGLSEQEARDLFYTDPSERAKKLNPEQNKTGDSLTNNLQSIPTDSNNGVLKRKQPILEAILPYISREQFVKVLKSQNYHGRNILHECVIKGDLKSMQLVVNELLQPKKSTMGTALRLAQKNVELTPEQKMTEKQKYDEESQENMQVLNDLLMETDNDKHQTCLSYACAESNTFAVRYLLSLYNIVGVQMNKRPVANSVANLSPNAPGGLLSTPRDNSRSASTANLSSPRLELKQNLMYKVLHMKNKQGKTPLDIAKTSHVPCDDIIEMLIQSIEKSGSSADNGSASAFQFFKRKKK